MIGLPLKLWEPYCNQSTILWYSYNFSTDTDAYLFFRKTNRAISNNEMTTAITTTMTPTTVPVVILLLILSTGGPADPALEARVGSTTSVPSLKSVCDGDGAEVALIWIDDFVVWPISECEVCLSVEMDGAVGGALEVLFVSAAASLVDRGVGAGAIKTKCCMAQMTL